MDDYEHKSKLRKLKVQAYGVEAYKEPLPLPVEVVEIDEEQIKRMELEARIAAIEEREHMRQRSKLMFYLSKTTEAVLGVEHIIEFQRERPLPFEDERYRCCLCDSNLTAQAVMPHLLGSAHRLAFMKLFYTPHYFKCNEFRIINKKKRDLAIRHEAYKVEQKHGRKFPKMRIELDPFFDSRKQSIKFIRPGDMIKLPNPTIDEELRNFIPPRERDRVASRGEPQAPKAPLIPQLLEMAGMPGGDQQDEGYQDEGDDHQRQDRMAGRGGGEGPPPEQQKKVPSLLDSNIQRPGSMGMMSQQFGYNDGESILMKHLSELANRADYHGFKKQNEINYADHVSQLLMKVYKSVIYVPEEVPEEDFQADTYYTASSRPARSQGQFQGQGGYGGDPYGMEERQMGGMGGYMAGMAGFTGTMSDFMRNYGGYIRGHNSSDNMLPDKGRGTGRNRVNKADYEYRPGFQAEKPPKERFPNEEGVVEEVPKDFRWGTGHEQKKTRWEENDDPPPAVDPNNKFAQFIYADDDEYEDDAPLTAGGGTTTGQVFQAYAGY
jgi:hypothetical protein